MRQNRIMVEKKATKVYFNVIDFPEERKFKLNIPDEYELGWHIKLNARTKSQYQ
jgi:hypothetical protein